MTDLDLDINDRKKSKRDVLKLALVQPYQKMDYTLIIIMYLSVIQYIPGNCVQSYAYIDQ